MSIAPGATALTRTPRPDHSTASWRVSWTIAPLLAEYAAWSLRPTTPEIEARLTIAPPPLSTRLGSASRQCTNTPRTFVRSTPSHSSSVVSSVGLRRKRAALLTRMSSRPNRSSAVVDGRTCGGAVGDVADEGGDTPVRRLERGDGRVEILGDDRGSGCEQETDDLTADARRQRR